MPFSLSDFLRSGIVMNLSQDRLLIGWGEFHRVLAKEIDLSRPAFYFSDFFLTIPRPWIQYSHWVEISKTELYHQLQSVQPFVCDWVIEEQEKFRQAFEELSQLLQAGQLQKGVPYVFAHSNTLMNEECFQNCLKRGLDLLGKKVGYLYGHWDGSSGVLGMTPELLFSHTKKQLRKVYTMALAGTCHPSHCQKSFLENEKERYEHQLVVQGICHALQPLGVVKAAEIQLLQLPNLIHLMTPIEVKLYHSFDFNVLVNCLHPTPALGAFPVKEGWKWLEKFEKHTPRRYYGAPIGFYYPQKGLSQCFVGIRNVQWDKWGMQIGAGCGVVKQSTFEHEWQEVQLKIKAIRELFYGNSH